MGKIPFDNLCKTDGLFLVSFETDSEYSVLKQVIENLPDKEIILIHSKLLDEDLGENVLLCDATGHSLTERAVLKARLKPQKKITVFENPADIRSFLINLRKLVETHKDIEYWIWWSPSDLLTQDIEEKQIAKCLRVISKDYSDVRFLVLIAKNIHSTRGFSVLEYISKGHFEVTRNSEGGYNWSIIKHPDTKQEGGSFVS